MASGLQSYTATFSGDFASYVGGKVLNAVKSARQEKENQKKAEELGIEVPAEEKKGILKKALVYEFGGRKFDQTVGAFVKNKTNKQVSSKSTFSDKFSYTEQLKKPKSKKSTSVGASSPTGRTATKKKGSDGTSLVKGFGELSLSLEQLNNQVGSLVSVANKQLGATYRTSGGIAGIQKILAEQNNLQKQSIEDAKNARAEASIDQTKDVSGSSEYKSSFDQTPEWDDETGQKISPPESRSVAGGDEGGGGVLDTLGNAADIADTALDMGKSAKNIGKRGIGRGLTRAGAVVGGKKGAKIGSKIGSKFFGRGVGKAASTGVSKAASTGVSKAASKGVGKAASKGVGKAALKGVAKGVGKSVIKKIPIIGAIAGLGFGIQRAMEGDWLGAAGEVASGVASTVPVAGTGVSVGIDAALMGRDIAKESTQPQAEGGVVPLSSKIAQKTLPSLIPGLGAASAMSSMMGGGGDQDADKKASQLPFKAIGGAILSITDGFVKALGPVGGIVAPMIKQQISPLSRIFGMPSSLAKFGGIGGAALQSSPQAMKQGMDFMKKFMEGALEKLGIKPKKEEKTTTTGGGGGGGSSPAPTTDDTSTGDTGGGGGGAAPQLEPGKRFMTADEFAAKNVKETKIDAVQGARGSTKAVVAAGQSNLVPVKDAELGGTTDYYHDTFGQVYKVNQDTKKLQRVTQDELVAGIHQDLGRGLVQGGAKKYFFRKPDKNVVVSTLTSAPENSIELGSRKIVKTVSARGSNVKQLKQPSEDDKKKFGIDQIKSPFGAASTAVPQVQAAAGTSVITKLGDGSKLASAPSGRCVTGVLETMAVNNVPNPQGTGNDGNNPRGLASQLIKSYGWGSIPGLGEKINLKSPYGNVGANAMSFGQWKDAVKSNKIPSGAIVFTTRNSDWSGNTSGGHDAAIAKSGGKKLWSGHWQAQADGVGAVYGNASNKIIALTPGGQQIPYTGSTSGDDGESGSGSGQQSTDPMEALKQDVLGAITGAQQLSGVFSGKKWEEVKDMNQGKSFTDIFNPKQTPDSSAGSTTTPPTKINPSKGTAANVQPNQQTATAPSKPETDRRTSPNSSTLASAVAGRPSAIIPLPIPPAPSGGAGSYHVKSSDFGTAENLRPQFASYLG